MKDDAERDVGVTQNRDNRLCETPRGAGEHVIALRAGIHGGYSPAGVIETAMFKSCA